MRRYCLAAVLAALTIGAAPSLAMAAQVTAPIALSTLSGPSAAAGTITLSDSPKGAVVTVQLHGLPPGQHGFHVHQNGDCGPGPVNGVVAPAGAAGGHYDPGHTGMHMGPMGEGHMGDLPYLTVAADGTDSETLTAPRLTDVTQVKGHALVIHAGGDNYADQPKPLGGGGARIACGVAQ